MAQLHESDIPGISANGAAFLRQLGDELTQLKAGFNQLLTDYNAHLHGGITAGAANSSAVAASSAVAVTATDQADQVL